MTRLSGFTFIRNAKKYDFPFREAVESMLPLIDELVINVGRSEDGTELYIDELIAGWKAAWPRLEVKRLDSEWDDSKTQSGLVLSEQTNIALAACTHPWALYLQGDEALHESEYAVVKQALVKADTDSTCEGVRFRYLHFYGGYTLIQRPWNWYPSEIRIIRTGRGIKSFGDAQTFRRADDSKLRSMLIDAHIHHYGHARHPEHMAQKIGYFHRFWHGDNHGITVKNPYHLDLKNLVWYWGTHPASYFCRATQGLQWSAKPPHWSEKNQNQHVYLLSSTAANRQLGRELIEVLATHGIQSSLVTCPVKAGLSAWSKGHKNPVFFDLDASQRPRLATAMKTLGALLFFKHRGAYVGATGLPRWLARGYQALCYTTHENAREGFSVPANKLTSQAALTLSVLCES